MSFHAFRQFRRKEDVAMDFNCLSPYDKMMLVFQLICAVDAAFGIYEKLHRRVSKHDN